jgi:hypothetical protein
MTKQTKGKPGTAAAASASAPDAGIGLPVHSPRPRHPRPELVAAPRLAPRPDTLLQVSPTWMTYRQAQELGGQVRRGERGSQVVYMGETTKRRQDDSSLEEANALFPLLARAVVLPALRGLAHVDDLGPALFRHQHALALAGGGREGPPLAHLDDLPPGPGTRGRLGRVTLAPSWSPLHGLHHGRTPCSRSATMRVVIPRSRRRAGVMAGP